MLKYIYYSRISSANQKELNAHPARNISANEKILLEGFQPNKKFTGLIRVGHQIMWHFIISHQALQYNVRTIRTLNFFGSAQDSRKSTNSIAHDACKINM